jgi:hypothetical protein
MVVSDSILKFKYTVHYVNTINEPTEAASHSCQIKEMILNTNLSSTLRTGAARCSETLKYICQITCCDIPESPFILKRVLEYLSHH